MGGINISIEHIISISIIIPTYNSEKYIVETIESALNQVDVVVEVLVIDDGSNDNTVEILKQSGLMNKIKYIYQKNQGLSAARNTGLANMTKDYCCFLDSDDLLEPTYCTELVNFMINSKIKIAYSNYQYFMDDTLKSEVNCHYPKYSGKVFEKFIRGNFIPVNAVLLRRDILESFSFDLELKSYEDWHFWINLSAKYSFYYYPKVLAKIRIRSGSMSTNSNIMMNNLIKVLEKTEIIIRQLGNLGESDIAIFYYGWALQFLTAKQYKNGLVKLYTANKYEINLIYNIKFILKLITMPIGLFPLVQYLDKKISKPKRS